MRHIQCHRSKVPPPPPPLMLLLLLLLLLAIAVCCLRQHDAAIAGQGANQALLDGVMLARAL
jgi:hypothetical protein